MKRPSWKELQRLNQDFGQKAASSYHDVLVSVLNRYHLLSGDSRGLGYLRNRDYVSLYKWSDSLPSEVLKGLVSSQVQEDAKILYFASQVSALIKKYPWGKDLLDLQPELAARKTFDRTERKCLLLNRKFRLLARGLFDKKYMDRTKPLRELIRKIIGVKPSYSYIYEHCDFGSGASIGIHGRATHLGRKLTQDKWTVSNCAVPYAFAAIMHNFQYSERILPRVGPYYCYSDKGAREVFESAISYVPYNKIAFVPKTAKTHRVIAVEPTLNTFVQKGIDKAIRNRLAKIGINLRDQSVNQAMALSGSWRDDEESWVTIDLSNASDSISTGMCRFLLPPAWFDLLNRTRSPSYSLDGVLKPYEKFCSMGNGFCFPLETLIFTAICLNSGCGRPGKDFHVYGDDIVVMKKHSYSVLANLKYFGFSVNPEKTFTSGPFRESCGSDWFKCVDVRPFTLDFALDTLQAKFKFLNLVRGNKFWYELLGDAFEIVLESIPEKYRFHRPFKGTVDSGINPIEEFEYPFTSRYWNKRYQCWSWFELVVSACADGSEYPDWVREAAYLRKLGLDNPMRTDSIVEIKGDTSDELFTFRRKTETRVRLVARSGDILIP